MSTAFAITHTWPDLKNAEYEVLQRVLGAAERIGARAVVVDRNGAVLWAHPELDLIIGDTLPVGAVAFLIAMHFESGRVLDCYSYFTLWQPIEIYHDFGYQRSIDKVGSYHDLLSCDSALADAHGLNVFTGLGRAPERPLQRMFHTLPEPFLEPRISAASNLFYIGINWERVGRPKGRFHDVLSALDRQSMVEIYGPELLMGVAVWEGYATYKGELAFDGVSVKHAVNRAGICLVLSSAMHKRTGIMSNRLFEGLAGGAAIVATPNAIIDKYFEGVVYPVDDSRGEEVLGQQIVAAVRQIRDDPDEARRRTLLGQQIMREHCSLEASLQALFEQTPARQAHFDAHFLAEARVSVILTYEGQSIEEVSAHLQQFQRQRRARVVVHLVCDERFARRHAKALTKAARGSLERVRLHPIVLSPVLEAFDGPQPPRARTGPATARALAQVDTPLFAFSCVDDEVFGDHFASAAKTLEQQPGAMMAASGSVVETETADRVRTREFGSARFVDFASIVLVNGAGELGRFVYRRALLDTGVTDLFSMLDGEEQSYFRLAGYLAGPLAQTSHASYLERRPARARMSTVEPIELQRQYIRDLFACDPRWIKALAAGSTLPEFVYAYSPGTPVRWADYEIPAGVTARLVPERTYLTRFAGEGLRFLGTGFSTPETEHIWVGAERATIEFTMGPADPDRVEEFTFVMLASGKRSLATGRNQHVAFAVNGMMTGYAALQDHPAEVHFPIPHQLLRGVHSFRIELTPDHADVELDGEGNVIDHRRLSICLRSFHVLRSLQRNPPVLAADQQYRCAAGQPGTEALNSNFHAPEKDWTWIAGTQGVVWFRLGSVPPAPELRLQLEARRMVETGEPPVVGITVNGVAMGQYQLAEWNNHLAIDLAALDLSGAGCRSRST